MKKTRNIIRSINWRKVAALFFIVLFVVALIVLAAYLGEKEGKGTLPPDVGTTFVRDNTHFVYVGASSTIYENYKGEVACRFIDIFDKISEEDLASIIDNDGFPLAVEYVACTNNKDLFLIEIVSDDGSIQTFWIEP